MRGPLSGLMEGNISGIGTRGSNTGRGFTIMQVELRGMESGNTGRDSDG